MKQVEREGQRARMGEEGEEAEVEGRRRRRRRRRIMKRRRTTIGRG